MAAASLLSLVGLQARALAEAEEAEAAGLMGDLLELKLRRLEGRVRACVGMCGCVDPLFFFPFPSVAWVWRLVSSITPPQKPKHKINGRRQPQQVKQLDELERLLEGERLALQREREDAFLLRSQAMVQSYNSGGTG